MWPHNTSNSNCVYSLANLVIVSPIVLEEKKGSQSSLLICPLCRQHSLKGGTCVNIIILSGEPSLTASYNCYLRMVES